MDKNMIQTEIKNRREIMKADESEEITSDQSLGLPQPPLTKEKTSALVFSLPKDFEGVLKVNDFLNLLNTRTSKRKYSNEVITLKELSFLLWATQGIKSVVGNKRKATLRTVPSAGARHPFETYLFINQVEGLEAGLYHYLPLEHELELLSKDLDQTDKVTDAFAGQEFFGSAPVSFVWTVVPYRSEWRYVLDAQKYALIDIGHLCQNLYLAGEAIGCGICAIGAYEQKLADQLLGLDSTPSADNDNEFVVYAASAGKVAGENK